MELHTAEKIVINQGWRHTNRLKVPGGWLYYWDGAMGFVPDPELERTECKGCSGLAAMLGDAQRGIDRLTTELEADDSLRADIKRYKTDLDTGEITREEFVSLVCCVTIGPHSKDSSSTIERPLCDRCKRSHDPSWNCVTAARGYGGGGPGEPYGT